MGTNFGRTFTTACISGKSPFQTVQTIAYKTGTNPATIVNNLKKTGCCFGKQFNGRTFCFPYQTGKPNTNTVKNTEFHFWQFATEFALQKGWVTPSQVNSWKPTQLFWFISQKFNRFYTKPRGFNPKTGSTGYFWPTAGTGTNPWFFGSNYGTGGTGNGYGAGTTRKTRSYGRKTRRTGGRKTTWTGGTRTRTGRKYGTRRGGNFKFRLVGRTYARRRAA